MHRTSDDNSMKLHPYRDKTLSSNSSENLHCHSLALLTALTLPHTYSGSLPTQTSHPSLASALQLQTGTAFVRSAGASIVAAWKSENITLLMVWRLRFEIGYPYTPLGPGWPGKCWSIWWCKNQWTLAAPRPGEEIGSPTQVVPTDSTQE